MDNTSVYDDPQTPLESEEIWSANGNSTAFLADEIERIKTLIRSGGRLGFGTTGFSHRVFSPCFVALGVTDALVEEALDKLLVKVNAFLENEVASVRKQVCAQAGFFDQEEGFGVGKGDNIQATSELVNGQETVEVSFKEDKHMDEGKIDVAAQESGILERDMARSTTMQSEIDRLQETQIGETGMNPSIIQQSRKSHVVAIESTRSQRNDIKAIYESKLAARQTELEDLEQQHAQKLETRMVEFQTLKSSHTSDLASQEQAIADIKRLHAAELDRTTLNLQRQLTTSQEASEAKLRSLTTEHATSVDKLAEVHDIRVKDLQSELDTKDRHHAAALSRAERRIEKQAEEHESELQALAATQKRKMDAMNKHIDADHVEHAVILADLQAQFEGQSAELETRTAELESTKADFQRRMAVVREEIDADHVEHAIVLADMQDKYRAQAAEFETQTMEVKAQTIELEALKTDLNAQTAKLETQTAELQPLKAELKRHDVRADEKIKTWEAAILIDLDQIQQQHLMEISDLENSLGDFRERHQLCISGLNAQHERAKGDLKVEHGRVVEDLKREHEGVVGDLEKRRDDIIQGLKEEHEAVINGLQATHEQAVANLKEEHCRKVEALAAQHSHVVHDLKKSQAPLKEEHAALTKKHTALQKEHIALKTDFATLKDAHVLDLSARSTAALLSHTHKLEATRRGLEERHAREIEAVKHDSEGRGRVVRDRTPVRAGHDGSINHHPPSSFENRSLVEGLGVVGGAGAGEMTPPATPTSALKSTAEDDSPATGSGLHRGRRGWDAEEDQREEDRQTREIREMVARWGEEEW